MPNIKWLKKIEFETTDSGTAAGKYPDIIDVGNEKFVVIQKSSSDDVVSTMQPGKKRVLSRRYLSFSRVSPISSSSRRRVCQ